MAMGDDRSEELVVPNTGMSCRPESSTETADAVLTACAHALIYPLKNIQHRHHLPPPPPLPLPLPLLQSIPWGTTTSSGCSTPAITRTP